MSKKTLDDLGVAIADAGYTWTPEMRNAYEKGVRKKWVGLTDEDFYGQSQLQVMAMKYAEAKLKEKNT